MLKILFVIVSSLSIGLTHAGGVLVGNGGTVVLCSGARKLQSLDYLLSKNILGKNVTLANISTLQESVERISELLEIKAPELSKSFQVFSKQIKNTNESKNYVWRIPKNGLEVIRDELIQLPLSCRNNYGVTEVYQAVVRKKANEKIIFEYDPELYSALEASPLQLSFLLVHEWLWDISDNVKTNRKINYFIHSTLLNQMSAEEVILQLKEFGVKI